MRTAKTKARALTVKGRYREALNIYEGILSKFPEDLESIVEAARIMTLPDPKVFAPREARELLLSAIRDNPNNAKLHIEIGLLYEFGMSEHELALREYRRALKLDPNEVEARKQMALLFEAPGVNLSIEEALDHLEAFTKLRANDWEARRERAKLLWRTGKLREAYEEYRKSLSCDPPPDPASAQQIRSWMARIEDGAGFFDGYLEVLRRD